MSDQLDRRPPPGDAVPDEAESELPAGRDYGRMDRLVSRSIALFGLALLAALWVSSGGRAVGRGAILWFAFAYASGKAAVGVWALWRRWPVWPALLAEGLAVAMAGVTVWKRTTSPIPLMACAALLLGAGFWRNRARSAVD